MVESGESEEGIVDIHSLTLSWDLFPTVGSGIDSGRGLNVLFRPSERSWVLLGEDW